MTQLSVLFQERRRGRAESDGHTSDLQVHANGFLFIFFYLWMRV